MSGSATRKEKNISISAICNMILNLEDNGQANETQDFDETIIYAFGDVSIKRIGYNQKLLHNLGLIYASPATVISC
jgi:hypothetical protein